MLNYLRFKNLTENGKDIIKKEDYVCYVRVYYRNGYGSAFFFNGTANGYAEDIKKAEERGRKRFTDILGEELKTVCETFCEGTNRQGKLEMLDFCSYLAEMGKAERSDYGYELYCETEKSVFKIVVVKDDDYFLRIFAFRKDE